MLSWILLFLCLGFSLNLKLKIYGPMIELFLLKGVCEDHATAISWFMVILALGELEGVVVDYLGLFVHLEVCLVEFGEYFVVFFTDCIA